MTTTRAPIRSTAPRSTRRRSTWRRPPTTSRSFRGPRGHTLDVSGAINDACSEITMLHDIGERAGKYLNDENWINAVNNYGSIRTMSSKYGSIHTGKYDADDTYALSRSIPRSRRRATGATSPRSRTSRAADGAWAPGDRTRAGTARRGTRQWFVGGAPGRDRVDLMSSAAALILVVLCSARPPLRARALFRPSPQARGFSCPLSFVCESSRRGNHEADRSPGPHQESRDGRCGGHVRPPRRCDPSGLRPADRLVDPPHPRAPRAGRRPHGVGLRAHDRPPGCRDGHERSRRRPTSSRRSPTRTSTPSRSS